MRSVASQFFDEHRGNKTAAAAELGISLKTLYNKLSQIEEERRSA